MESVGRNLWRTVQVPVEWAYDRTGVGTGMRVGSQVVSHAQAIAAWGQSEAAPSSVDS